MHRLHETDSIAPPGRLGRWRGGTAAALAFLAVASPAVADLVPITGLANTGRGLAGGTSDDNWSILSPAQKAVVVNDAVIPSTWLANTAESKWIWIAASGQPTNTTAVFRISFDLAGLDASTARITGRWAMDNLGDAILLNGVSTGISASGFGSWKSFEIASGFVAGVNTLDFKITDTGVISGFRAELSGTVQTLPAPSTLAILGAASLGGRRRRRKA